MNIARVVFATLTAVLICGIFAPAAMAEQNFDAEIIYDVNGEPCVNAQTETITCLVSMNKSYRLAPGESLIKWPSGELLVIPNQFAYGYVTNDIQWNSIRDPNSDSLPDHFKRINGQELCFGTAASVAYSLNTGGSFEDFWEGVAMYTDGEFTHPTSLMNKARDSLLENSPIAEFFRQSGFKIGIGSLNSDMEQINLDILANTVYIATNTRGHAVVVHSIYIEDNTKKIAYIDSQMRQEELVPTAIRTGNLSNFNDSVIIISP